MGKKREKEEAEEKAAAKKAEKEARKAANKVGGAECWRLRAGGRRAHRRQQAPLDRRSPGAFHLGQRARAGHEGRVGGERETRVGDSSGRGAGGARIGGADGMATVVGRQWVVL